MCLHSSALKYPLTMTHKKDERESKERGIELDWMMGGKK